MNKRILFSASIFHGLNDAAGIIVPMVFPILLVNKWLISSYSRIGILTNLGLLVTLLFQVVIAQTSERFEFRTLLLGSVAGLVGTLLLMTTAATFLTLLAYFAVFRMFTSFYHPLGIAWVSRTHPSGAIDKAMGIQGGSGDLGVFIAYLFSGFLLQRGSWKAPLIGWAAVMAVLGAVSYVSVRRVSTRDETFRPPRLVHWRETLKRIKVYVPGIIFEGAGWTVTIYYAPTLFSLKFRDSLGQTGLWLALWIGLGALVAFFFGRLSRAVGRMTLTLLGCSLAGLALVILGLAPTRPFAVLGIVLLGLSLFNLYPAFQSFVGNTVPRESQAVAFSLVANIQVLSGALLALVAGFLADLFGLGAAFLVTGALGLAVAVFYAIRHLSGRLETES
jgi:MFS family permease